MKTVYVGGGTMVGMNCGKRIACGGRTSDGVLAPGMR
jgi:hypothetical protein